MINPVRDVCIAPFKLEQYEQFLIWLGLSEEFVKKIEIGGIELSLVLDYFQEEQEESPRIYYSWKEMCIVFYGFEENEFLKPILENANNFFRYEKWVYPKVQEKSWKFKIYPGIFD